jgi:hypothetical protein
MMEAHAELLNFFATVSEGSDDSFENEKQSKIGTYLFDPNL